MPNEPVNTRWPSGWLVPDWPLPAGVRAVFVTRADTLPNGRRIGHSTGAFGAINLRPQQGEDASVAAANVAAVERALGVPVVMNRQVHGFDVHSISVNSASGLAFDACITADAGVACSAAAADCLPLLWCCTHPALPQPLLAAAHAGWRGLCGELGPSGRPRGIVEAVFEAIGQGVAVFRSFDAIESIANHISVWLGPCIGPGAFEVGNEVRNTFTELDLQATTQFEPGAQPGKWQANLSGLARQRLQALGVTNIHGNDATPPWCTVSNPSRFHSHRRDTVALGASGRMAAFIWREVTTC